MACLEMRFFPENELQHYTYGTGSQFTNVNTSIYEGFVKFDIS